MEYKGYTIEKIFPGFQFYETASGIDCDYDGQSWRTNVKFGYSIEDCHEQIDEIINEAAI